MSHLLFKMQPTALSPWLSPNTLRSLADKLYEKRKAAALEVEQATKALATAGDLISVVRSRKRPPAGAEQVTGSTHRPAGGRVCPLPASEPQKGGAQGCRNAGSADSLRSRRGVSLVSLQPLLASHWTTSRFSRRVACYSPAPPDPEA